MSLNADRTINRAMVAGCVISATRNYLKLHMPETLNPHLVQPSCQEAKVVHAFCGAGCRLPTHAWSANRPLTRCPPRATPTPRAGATPFIERDANMQSS
jgi:hypothetical protein